MFGGSTFDEAQDGERCRGQLARVKAVLSDGKPRTLTEVADAANVPLSTVGSRIRDLRKDFAGAFNVCSRRVSKGTWTYWIPQQPKIVFDDRGQGLMGFDGVAI